MPDPTSDSTAVPTPSAGQKLITVGLAVLGALPASGLFGDASPVLKVAGLVVIGLAALGYGTTGSALKTAHAAGKRSASTDGGAS